MDKNAKTKNCLFEASDIAIENFRRDDDGRKWRKCAEARWTLYTRLAGRADPDGTNAFPGIKRLMQLTGWSHGKTCYVLDELSQMGLATRVGLHGKRGTAIRKLTPPVKRPKPESSQTESESLPVEVQHSRLEVQHSGLGVQDSRLEVQHSSSRSPTMVGRNLPLSDLPDKPEKRKREEPRALPLSDSVRYADAGKSNTERLYHVAVATAVYENSKAGFSAKAKAEIKRALSDSAATEEEVKSIVKEMVRDMDGFTLPNAGSAIAASLTGRIIAYQKEQRKKREGEWLDAAFEWQQKFRNACRDGDEASVDEYVARNPRPEPWPMVEDPVSDLKKELLDKAEREKQRAFELANRDRIY